MSNAKLKEQIEAAKIALVNSPEFETSSTSSRVEITSATTSKNSLRSNPTLKSEFDAISSDTSVATNVSNVSEQRSETHDLDTMPKLDFKVFESRIKGLEEQIQNQQRDLHTLLQKLREITIKSKNAAVTQKTSGKPQWFLGFFFVCGAALAAYYMLELNDIIASVYNLIGWAVALIDTLLTKL
jgi:chaperonin cofactor prefoldin